MNRLLEIFRACSPITSAVTVLFFVAPLAAGAQPAGTVHRIGFLGNSTAALEAHLVGPFREGLHELGHVEGQNIAIQYRWAEGKYERFPEELMPGGHVSRWPSLAAYLYPPREPGDKSHRTAKAVPGLVIDFNRSGKAHWH